jgi:hypothetical protein
MRSGPVTPSAMRLQDALAGSLPLAALQRRIRESNARFETVSRLLPPALAAHVQPGPIDAEGWSLLVANPAVAAKLRQLQPRLQAALVEAGWPAVSLRIKVRAG